MKKYIMLINHDRFEDKKLIKILKEVFPTIKFEDYGYIYNDNPEKVNDYISSWVQEEEFLAAWTFVNFFPKYEYTDEISIDQGVDYLNLHLNNNTFIKYYD